MYTVTIYFLIFWVFTGVHLYASLNRKNELRSPTKMVLILALLGMYLEWMHVKGVQSSSMLVFALLTSWLGDVFLIPKGVRWFTIGGISFLISHFLYISAYCESGIDYSRISPVLIILISAVYLSAIFVLFSGFRKCLPKALFAPTLLYLMTNGAMNVFAWLRMLGGSCPVFCGLITAIGALLFFISDCTLFFVRFDRNCPLKSHFLVMLSYSIGKFLLVLGFMLAVV